LWIKFIRQNLISDCEYSKDLKESHLFLLSVLYAIPNIAVIATAALATAQEAIPDSDGKGFYPIKLS